MEKRSISSLGMFFRFAVLLGAALLPAASMARDLTPWTTPANALVIDAYELNIIDWEKMLEDKRIAGFISKSSDGLPESFSCTAGHRGDTVAHCKTMWRKYAVSRELYQTRRLIARANGLLWGAYHLARPGNPIDQANHFLDYAEPRDDEMMVLDIEGIDAEKYMSLDDAGIFAGHIKARTGRFPTLYTNHATAKYIAANRDRFPVLSRLPLWYARYKPGIKGVFPMGNWDSYTLWQFSSASNCGKRRCPYRVAGTLRDIDVNVAAMDAETLKSIWAKGELVPEKPFPKPLLIANGRGSASAGTGIGIDLTLTGSIDRKTSEIAAR
ncbi:glycoside hydrolase family 25 protein [Pararhizobium gei]|uniref:glycoside hydrolase family 25 protein n=1 Tax=Pararhizobium gei TaxID=1395951 RepID=UPI0023DA3835|nr:GH25 family lysozyme [Rhizobium gei]